MQERHLQIGLGAMYGNLCDAADGSASGADGGTAEVGRVGIGMVAWWI